MKLQENFGILKLPKATVYINLSGKEAFLNLSSQQQKKIKASGVFVKYRDPEAERLKILNEISLKEIYRLLWDKCLITRNTKLYGTGDSRFFICLLT